MAKKLELTWIASLKQWRKVHKGKQHYFGTGANKSDAESYARALAKWYAFRDQSRRTEMEEATSAGYAKWRDALASRSPQAMAAMMAPTADATLPDDHDPGAVSVLTSIPLGSAKVKQSAKSMGDFLTLYIADQKRRYDHGLKFKDAPQSERISGQRYIAYRYNAELMRKAWGNDPLPDSEARTAKLMIDFRDTQRALLTAEKIATATYNERMKTMRHFFGWMHDNYHIDQMPRKASDICAKYSVKSSAKAIDLKVIRQLWTGADDELKKYIALALNCGCYAVDVANIPTDALKGEYLYYDRHKTGVPIRYKLWAVTRELLARHTPGKVHLFEDATGGQLLTVDVEGKGQRKSRVDNKWYIACRKMDLKGVSYSHLRDTSTTRIEAIDRTASDLFDAHKDARMARFYIDGQAIDYDLMCGPLDKATDELAKWYNLP